MFPPVMPMDDAQARLYYARLRGEALGIRRDADELAELLRTLCERPGLTLEEMPLDLAAWFPARRNTIEHIRSEVLLMAGRPRGVRARLKALLRR